MPGYFQLDVLTPDKLFISQPVRQVIFTSPSGRIGVLTGHMPMIAAVLEGALDIQIQEGWKTAAASQGFAEIFPDGVKFFLDTAEWAEEIDVVRAKEALDRASARLKGNLSHIEYIRTHAAVARAMTRLKVTGQTR